jgi:hypothetical protein
MAKSISPCNLRELNGSFHLSIHAEKNFALISVMVATYFPNS